MSTITGAPDHCLRVPATVHNGSITFSLEERFNDFTVVQIIIDPLSNEVTALISLKKEPKP